LKKLRIGILGGSQSSAVGYAHVSALRLIKHVQLAGGMFSRDYSENSRTLIAYGLENSPKLNSIEQFCDWAKSENLDLIVVLTPTNQHFTQLMILSELRIPVLVEKALATSPQEGGELAERYSKLGLANFVMFNYTGYPMLREMKSIVKSWVSKDLVSIKLEMPQDSYIKLDNKGNFQKPQAWRARDYVIPTLALDLGVHLYALSQYLFEQEISTEINHVRNLSIGRLPDVIDDMLIGSTLENGCPIDLWFSKAALGKKNGLKVTIFGRERSIEWIQEFPDEILSARTDGSIEILRRGDTCLDVANDPRYTRFKGGHPTGFIEAMANYYEDILSELRSENIKSKDSINRTFNFFDALKGLQFFATANSHR
jgi:predicted dehydrogenase